MRLKPLMSLCTANSIVSLHNHNTSPNILDDVLGFRGRCLLSVDVDRKQTRIAVSKCLIVERHTSVLIAVLLFGCLQTKS